MFAVTDFIHYELEVKAGDKLPVDHPMVLARPDLFSNKKPGKGDTPTIEKE